MQKYILIVAALCLGGCASPPKDAVHVNSHHQLPSIQQKERERLERITPGMSWDDVKAIFPEVYPVSLDDRTQAYELESVTPYVTDFDKSVLNRVFSGGVRGNLHRQILWFYTIDGILIKWGSPRDWPTKKDIERFL